MSNALKIAAGVGGSVTPLYVDDVFSAYTYTGNGSTQNINNGIDLAGKGGLVWVKARNSTGGHVLVDSERGTGTGNVLLSTESTSGAGANTANSYFQSLNSNGFTVGVGGNQTNNALSLASWTFRKAPKFFDVVTYTGNAVAGRAIPHSLGVKPGMMIVKATNTTKDWYVWHRSLSSETTSYLVLNSTAAVVSYNLWNTAPDSTNFYLANTTDCNGVGISYVAYLFAHDPSADGIIQCGSFTTDGIGTATVNLGWEPQYILVKPTAAAPYNDWLIIDSSRDFSVTTPSGARKSLKANRYVEEDAYGSGNFGPNATGFSLGAGGSNMSTPYIYMAIRRPNKPPTSGTQVYNAIARTGTGAAATVTGVGFAPDLVIDTGRSGGYAYAWWDKLRGANKGLTTSSAAAEVHLLDTLNSFDHNGITVGTDANLWINHSGAPYINHFFKRAPGVFDIVCYTGTGVAKTEAHNLGVAPELMIVKSRSGTTAWTVYPKDPTKTLFLNTTDALYAHPSYWNNTAPTPSVFSVNNANETNQSGITLVAYLFASKAGISKVGSYTGNGTSQTINCGFTTGARFILIKRTDSAGDWYVWDSVRGIVAANDPHLSLNTTAAEVTTDDSVDADTSGFIVNQVVATNINVASATYIFLAFS